jgi:hypothetical protein
MVEGGTDRRATRGRGSCRRSLELALGVIAAADVLGEHHVPGLDCAENVDSDPPMVI